MLQYALENQLEDFKVNAKKCKTFILFNRLTTFWNIFMTNVYKVSLEVYICHEEKNDVFRLFFSIMCETRTICKDSFLLSPTCIHFLLMKNSCIRLLFYFLSIPFSFLNWYHFSLLFAESLSAANCTNIWKQNRVNNWTAPATTTWNKSQKNRFTIS